MNNKKKILLIGWHPDVVDYSKWPELNPEKLRSMLEADKATLNAQGYEASWCYLLDAGTAVDTAVNELSKKPYACVLIGGGVRLDPDSLLVFECLINAIHSAAPQAKICFNTNPADTADAVKRWI